MLGMEEERSHAVRALFVGYCSDIYLVLVEETMETTDQSSRTLEFSSRQGQNSI